MQATGVFEDMLLSAPAAIYIYIYIYIYMHTYIHVYVYIYRHTARRPILCLHQKQGTNAIIYLPLGAFTPFI
jgi:hypothetical protein